MLLHVSLKPSGAAKGFSFFKSAHIVKMLNVDMGPLLWYNSVMDCLVWFSSWFVGRSGGRQNPNLLQYLAPASLWGNGFMGFSRRPPFSLCPLHQLSTKSTSLKMKPVLLSSHGRVCGTGNFTESRDILDLDPATPSLLLPKHQLSTLSQSFLGGKDFNQCNYNVVSFKQMMFPLISKFLFKYKSK